METFTKDQVIGTIASMCDIIIENEVPFCELDSAAGDGDFGMSLAKGFKVVKAEWANHSRDDIGAFLKDCGMIISQCRCPGPKVVRSGLCDRCKLARDAKESIDPQITEGWSKEGG